MAADQTDRTRREGIRIDLLKNGVMPESESPWNFSFFPAQKLDGSTCDYRARDEVTVKVLSPSPPPFTSRAERTVAKI